MTRPTDGLPPAGRTNRGEVPSPGTPARAAEISVRGGGARERGAPGLLIRFSCVRYLQMLRTLKKRGKHLNRRTLAYFSLLGLTGIALSMPILQLSILYAGSGVAAVLFSCNPVFVTFLAFFLLGEPIRPRHIAALLLEVAGTVAIISPWNTRLSMTGVALADFGANIPIIEKLPLASLDLEWILPAAICGLMGAVIPAKRRQRTATAAGR